jgi:hypothetical protein
MKRQFVKPAGKGDPGSATSVGADAVFAGVSEGKDVQDMGVAPERLPTKMPPTWIDLIRKHNGILLDGAEADARKLRKAGRTSPIRSNNEYASSLERVSLGMARECQAHGVDPGQIDMILAVAEISFYAMLNWSLSGQKVFLCADQLAENLIHTELNVNADLIQVPFDSFVLVFKSPEAMDAFYAGEPNDRARRSGGSITVSATMFPTSLDLPGRTLVLAAAHSDGDRNYLMKQRSLYLPDEWSVEQVIHTDWDELRPGDEKGFSQGVRASAGGMEHVSDQGFYTDGKLFYRLVLNTILYLSSKDPDLVKCESGLKRDLEAVGRIKNPAKQKKAAGRLEGRKESALDFILVGNAVNGLQDAENDPQETGRRTINRQFVVRGHWRNQAYGPGRQEHRVMWIKPFYKGPDVAEMINRPYLIK